MSFLQTRTSTHVGYFQKINFQDTNFQNTLILCAIRESPVQAPDALLPVNARKGIPGAPVQLGVLGAAHLDSQVLRLKPRLDDPQRVREQHGGHASSRRCSHVDGR